MLDRVYLVTGAGGFLGSHLVQAVRKAGARVLQLGHGLDSSSGGNEVISGGVTIDALRMLPATPDVIIHCAGSGSVGLSQAAPLRDFDRAVRSLAVVLEYARTLKAPPVVVFPSSAAVYGELPPLPASEGLRPAPVSVYGFHKSMGEALCHEFSANFGVPCAIVRLFSLYGPGLKKQLLWDACSKFTSGSGTFFGQGAELRDLIHVNDAVELILRLVDQASPDCPTLNGGTGEAVTVRQIVQAVASALGFPGAVVFTGAVREGDPPHYLADIDAARSLVGWSPTRHWREGVREYVDWFKASGRGQV